MTNRARQSFFSTCIVAAVFAAGCAARPGDRFEQQSRNLQVCAAGPTLEGIDVSKWCGDIDWDQVAATGLEFAIIRVSDGLNYYDYKFTYNWAEARRVGITRGVYQYFRPSQDPIAQANLLITEVGALETGDLPPVIDVETSDGQSTSTVVTKVQQWLDHVEAGLGVTPIIYTSPGLWNGIAASTA